MGQAGRADNDGSHLTYLLDYHLQFYKLFPGTFPPSIITVFKMFKWAPDILWLTHNAEPAKRVYCSRGIYFIPTKCKSFTFKSIFRGETDCAAGFMTRTQILWELLIRGDDRLKMQCMLPCLINFLKYVLKLMCCEGDLHTVTVHCTIYMTKPSLYSGLE